MCCRLTVNEGKIKSRASLSISQLSPNCVSADNPTQIASVSVAVKVLDVNDNPPSLTHYLEAYVCDNAKAGQVRTNKSPTSPVWWL